MKLLALSIMAALLAQADAGGKGSGRRCTGKDPCDVCRDCSACARCTSGRASCGVCRNQTAAEQRRRDAIRAIRGR